ncbi:MAG: DUF2207 domain-containing protein [Gammaproteobacteria bacterium]|nr:DUF2207 domain-containing protein [Gammaproteobacteria bacterium]
MTTLARLLLAVLMLVPLALPAAERILDFHADIVVHADGTIALTETIRVRAEGREIRRGIFRDLPTTYHNDFGRRVTVAYTDIAVLRDGRPEPHHRKRLSNGIRIYIGDENRFLGKGDYTYTLSYRTDRQLGFFDNHDELYWNVTGTGWRFPIDKASASVRLPPTVPGAEMRMEAYTGPQGAKGQDYLASLDMQSAAQFRTTRALAANEGLTIVVAWPKGHVVEPSSQTRLAWFLDDNGGFVAAGAGLLILLVYYSVAWSRVGRDPKPGIVIPRYEPPKGYSPASMRYVRRMGYDDRTFAAALINLAVKGRLVIDDDGGDYVLEKGAVTTGDLAPGEAVVLRRLFAAGDRLKLERKNHKRIKSAIRAHSNRLEADYEKRYFSTNAGYTVFGVLVSLVALAASVLINPGIPQIQVAGFMVIWLSIWSFGVLTLSRAVYGAWRNADGILGAGGAMFLTLFALPFFAAEIMGIFFLAQAAGVAIVVSLVLLVSVNWLFYELMKAPTRLGRRLLDEVDGFLDYLMVAESDELRFRQPPEKTPELFERYLPYALALDVEAIWGEKFAAVIAAARRDGSYRQPGWYRGSSWRGHSAGAFAASLGSSLSGAVASSSTAPGSSSGSGGGGSSGGGGGGGGGGGW